MTKLTCGRVVEAMSGSDRITETLTGVLDGAVLEIAEGQAPVLRGVTLIRAGESANRRIYSAEVLRRDGPSVFEGVPAYATNHNPADKTIRNLVGAYRGVHYDDTAEALRGDLHVIDANRGLVDAALQAHALLGPSRVGLSIDTAAMFTTAARGKAREVVSLRRTDATSVDLVINPAAGGRLAEAIEEDREMLERIRQMTAEVLSEMSPAAVRFVVGELTEEQVREANPDLCGAIYARLNEATTAAPGLVGGVVAEGALCCCLLAQGCGCCHQTAPQAGSALCCCTQPMGCCSHQIPPQNPAMAGMGEAGAAASAGQSAETRGATLTEEQVREIAREQANVLACARVLESRIAGLGGLEQEVVRARFGARAFTDAELDTEIARVRDQAGRQNANRTNVPGTGGSISRITESFDANRMRLEAAITRQPFIEANGRRYEPFRRISEAMLAFHPEMMESYAVREQRAAQEALGHMAWQDGADLYQAAQEATAETGTFANAWADVLHRVLLREVAAPELNVWQQLVSDRISFTDLTNNYKLVQLGELGEMTSRSEGETITEWATGPDDRKQELAPGYYSDLYSLTWQAVLRDDIGVLARIPRWAGRAWARTRYKVFFRLLQANSGAGQTMGEDSTYLYHSNHANIASSALAATALETVRAKMPVQTDPQSGERLNYQARFLLFSTPGLDQTTAEILESQYKTGLTSNIGEINVLNWAGRLNLLPVPVIYPTASTTRWELVANPADCPTFAVGSLNGREDPDITVADQLYAGSRFTANKIVYKVEGTFGAAAVDFRSFSRGNA